MNYLGFDFYFDRFGIFLTVLFLFIGLMSFIYALATIRKKGHRLEYYLMLLLIVGSGIGVALSYNLLMIFILWEISTFAIWRAVAYYREEQHLNAANFTLILNFVAAAIMLVGIVILFLDNGTFNMFEITVYNDLAVVFIMVGILAKSVTLPLHVWLVPAYNAIPSAIGGCLAGIAENLGVILFLRLFATGSFVAPYVFTTVAWIAIASSILLGGAALLSNNLRSLLAYSTISQVGFILLGFAVGGTYGIVGGMLYIMAHALAKAGLFYGVGIVEDMTGKDDLSSLCCMQRASPVLGVMMALLFGSIVGFFPMIGFFSKLWVILGAVNRNGYLGVGAIVAAIFTLLYNARFYHELFFAKPQAKLPKTQKPSYVSMAVVFILAVASLLLGIFFYQPVTYLTGNGGY
ncbi:NADH dehydrogenase [candidate division WOR-3 bacterium]|nr:NADH dehydrogenase [candidate division WOR-3 bacterium]